MRGFWKCIVTIFIMGIAMGGSSMMAQSTAVKNIVLVHDLFYHLESLCSC
jgi:hypothetical protein